MDGVAVAGCLMDLALYVFHNATALLTLRGRRGVYLYLPKMENHLEARWWNDVLAAIEDYMGLARGTIRATVLIEVGRSLGLLDRHLVKNSGLDCGLARGWTQSRISDVDVCHVLPMLGCECRPSRPRSRWTRCCTSSGTTASGSTADVRISVVPSYLRMPAGQQPTSGCCRSIPVCPGWDYCFSYIKRLKAHGQFLTPDRRHLTMSSPFMQAYVRLLIYTCHRRGTFAMGGMAAQIPIKGGGPEAEQAMASVKADKLREVRGEGSGAGRQQARSAQVVVVALDGLCLLNPLLDDVCTSGEGRP